MAKSAKKGTFFQDLMQYEADFDKAKHEKNPFGMCTLAEGTYIAILNKLVPAEFGKQGAEKSKGVRFMCTAVMDLEGNEEGIRGEPCNSSNIFKETEKSSMKESFARFTQTIQSLGFETGEMSLRTLEEDIDALNDEMPMFIKMSVSDGSGGYVNCNIRSAVSQAQLDELGLDLNDYADDVKQEVGESGEDDEAGEEEDDSGEESEGGDYPDFDGMDRNDLKQLNVDEELGVVVKKSMSDDDVREAVKAAYDEKYPQDEAPFDGEDDEAGEEEEEAGEEEEEEEVKSPPKKSSAKKTSAKKSTAKKAVGKKATRK